MATSLTVGCGVRFIGNDGKYHVGTVVQKGHTDDLPDTMKKEGDAPEDIVYVASEGVVIQVNDDEIVEVRSEAEMSLREKLREKWGNLVFRRVKRVIAKPEDVRVVVSHQSGEPTTIEDARLLPEEQRKRHVEECYTTYFGFTLKDPIHDDPFAGKEIYFNYRGDSSAKGHFTYCPLDLDFSMTGDWSTHFHHQNRGQIPPWRGALVCGEVVSTEDRTYYKKWFTCSTQFRRLWEFIMGEETEYSNALHESLLTNDYREFLLANPSATNEERAKNFWVRRTEPSSFHRYLYPMIASLVTGDTIPSDWSHCLPHGEGTPWLFLEAIMWTKKYRILKRVRHEESREETEDEPEKSGEVQEELEETKELKPVSFDEPEEKIMWGDAEP